MVMVRKAQKEDCSTLFAWRNDNQTRKMFRSSRPVEWTEHCEWMDKTLKDNNSCLFMCLNEIEESLAVVKFDIKAEAAEISINLSPLFRGQGLSLKCLTEAINVFVINKPKIRELKADIKIDNLPSKTLFERAGFELQMQTAGFYHYIKSTSI